MAKKKFEYPLAYVLWEDAYTRDEWTDISEAKSHTPALIHTIGWLLDESNEHVTIVQSLGDNEARSRLTVPVPYIKSMEIMMGNGRWKKTIPEKECKDEEPTETTV